MPGHNRDKVSSEIVAFDNPRSRARALAEFEDKARAFLGHWYSLPLPDEVSSFLALFAEQGMDGFPEGGSAGRRLEIETGNGLVIRLSASAGMYRTDPDYGHVTLEVARAE